MTARHRDLEFMEGELALTPQRITGAGSDITGQTLTLQDYESPQSAKFICMLNSADSADDVDFTVEESSDGGSTWSETSYSVTGLDDTTDVGVIEVDNVQDLPADIRVKMDSTNSSLSSTDVEIGAAVIFGGKKTV